MQGCQVCTVPFWSQYHKKGILTYTCICKLESSSCDTVIRMEQYIPDTTAYVRCNPLLVILWSEWNSTYLTAYAVVSGMYCSNLITVSQEGHSKLHMQGFQVCTVPFWSQYNKKRIPTYICRGVRSCICKLKSPSSDTVIRMEQYIPDTPAYLSWNPLLVILWSEWNSTYLTRSGVRYVLFHSDHSITRGGF
jgi:hypothetical protein